MRNFLLEFILIFSLGTLNCIKAGEISPDLLFKLEQDGEADAILELPSNFQSIQARLSLSRLSGAAKNSLMVNLMQRSTQQAQAPFVSEISRLGLLDATSRFWITNDIAVTRLNLSSALALSALPGGFVLREPVTVRALVEAVELEIEEDIQARQESIQWGVERIQAPQVWASGTKGRGVVVAGIDTGVYREHASLRDNYDGRWFDAVYGLSQPQDRNGHGTHTMSIAVGRANGVGVAPDAKWIACRGLNNQGSGTEAWLKACGQWVLQQRPQVVINSWGASGGQTFYNDVIRAWRAAGIVPVFSIGNSGRSGCRTAGSPGDQPNLISVGSTVRNNDQISDFSSRGYSVEGRLKPEVSAPGSDILAAYYRHPTDYTRLSGTSMACPNVAGAVALILSARPSMTFDQVLSALTRKADQPNLGSNDLVCGKNSSSNFPNNVYGFGRINVRRAMGL